MSAAAPVCPECNNKTPVQRGTPCQKCMKAWKWLQDESDRELHERWWGRVVPDLREAIGEDLELVEEYLTIVSWENRVVTIAGWRHSRSWFARRYTDVLKAVLVTDKDPVFVTTRVGATIAQKIKREKEK